MAWDFDITFPTDMGTTLSDVKPGELLQIDNWVNGKILAVALDSGSFNTSSGTVEYMVFAEGKVQKFQDWQMRISKKL